MRRMVLLLSLVTVVAASGCGGGSSPSDASQQWANDVCGATLAWKNQLTKLVGGVRVADLTTEGLRTTAASAQAVTETYASTLKSLGPPETNAGTEAKQSIDALAADVSKSAASIRAALESSTVSTAATTIATAASSMKSSIDSTVKQLQSLDTKGELQDAFKSADNCSTLTGS